MIFVRPHIDNVIILSIILEDFIQIVGYGTLQFLLYFHSFFCLQLG